MGLWEVSMLDKVVKMGLSWWIRCSYRKRHQSTCTLSRHKALWAHRKTAPPQVKRKVWEWNLLSRPLDLGELWEVNFCCLTHPIDGIFVTEAQADGYRCTLNCGFIAGYSDLFIIISEGRVRSIHSEYPTSPQPRYYRIRSTFLAIYLTYI